MHRKMMAGTLSLVILPLPAANPLDMHGSIHIDFQLPYLQDQKSLTLS